MVNERFNRALRAMKAIGLSTNVVSPVLKHLLKLYNNQWELIEEENYSVLADAVCLSQEEGEEAPLDVEDEEEEEEEEERELPRRGKRNFVADEEEDYEYVPPLTRARSGVTIHEREYGDSPPRDYEPLHVEDEVELGDIKGKKVAEKKGNNGVCGRGKRIAKEAAFVASPAVLKKPKIENGVEGEEKDRVSTPLEPRRNPNVENCPISNNLPVMKVLPITAVNMASSPQKNAEYVCDFKEPQRREEANESQGGSTQCFSALGAIAEAYMEMDGDEDLSSELVLAKPKTHLAASNCDANVQHLSHPFLNCNDGLEGSGNVQLCLEYNNGTGESDCTQRYLEFNDHNEESDHALACLDYNRNLQVSVNGKARFDHRSDSTEQDIPQLSVDGVLKMVEVYTLQSFRMLAPNFPPTKLMERFCQHFLKSRNNQSCIENRVQVVSAATNLLMENDQRKVRRSPRINERSEESSPDDKSKEHTDSRDNASTCTALIRLDPCGLDIEQSRPSHDLKDITRGEEIIPIPIVNELSSETCPPRFQYIQKNTVYQSAYVDFSLARIGDDDCCSNCFGNCLESPITCACARETGGEYAYTKDGTLNEDFLEEAISLHSIPKPHQYFYCKDCPIERIRNERKPDPCKGHLIRKFIKECWNKCGCNKQCGNRVVQRGITCKLQVFLTPEGKGWGVRTLEGLPRGSFVCEYVGEIITNTELYYRNNERKKNEKHTYPVLLDADWCCEGVLKDEEALCLDATHYGNVARFINHRCYDANLMEIPVEVESPDRHYYHLAFFTTRKVDALEELTWDYKIDFEDHWHPIKAFECRCGSGHCRDIKPLMRRRKLHR